MERREFLRLGAAAAGGLLLAGKADLLSVSKAAAARSQVWMAVGSPVQAAQILAEAIQLKGLFPAGGVVLIKPNIAFPAPPQWGATTDPEFLGGLIDYCLEAGARRIIVVDHPVGVSPQQNLERTGIGAVCSVRSQAQVLMLEEEKLFRDCEVPKGQALHETKIAKVLDKVDLLINLPTAKHHAQTRVSLGFKNLMGLVWDRTPFHEQLDMDQAIADLGTVIKPHVTFLDAHYALLTGGPTGPGQVEEVGKYLAGCDPLAVDAVGVGLARWNGRMISGVDVPHLVKARDMALGVLDPESIEVIEVG